MSRENLVSLATATPEQRKAYAVKSNETKMRKKKQKEIVASAAMFAFDVDNSRETIIRDGKKKKVPFYEIEIEVLKNLIKDYQENPRIALEALKLLGDMRDGNPKVINQFNFHHDVEKKRISVEERVKEFDRLMGEKEDAVDVEVVVKDAE